MFKAFTSEIRFLFADIDREIRSLQYGRVRVWIKPQVYYYAQHRVHRACFLLFGGAWSVLKISLLPYDFLLRILFGHRLEIAQEAEIGPGLKICHLSLGCVIHSRVRCGKNLTLYGGNVLGMKSHGPKEFLKIGDNVVFGVQGIALGPLSIGDNAQIGANGTAVKNDIPSGRILVANTRLLDPEPMPHPDSPSIKQ